MALSCNKKLSELLGGITSKKDDDTFCLNCLLYHRTKHKHKKVFESKFFVWRFKGFWRHQNLKLNSYHKSDKEPEEESDADLQCLTKNIDGCKYYLEKSSATKVGKHQVFQYL